MTVTSDDHGRSRIDRERKTAFVSHDWTGNDSLTTTIVSTIAALSNSDPIEVDRLYDQIDPESLETLFAPTSGAAARNTGQVSFRLDAYTITVHATGDIVVVRST
ncbi:HalOD1 output domain-containing protein [Natrinema sp. SYSU A 869]|uniref:HalOD1 output domain-containing protein n=1 Tax=Natrinema sp. SYSU A 869 TaxID=2871694 RepID=UPI001CA3A5D5|nr:HalOD1 output domain-containing protein [Natrinema sp. SYSU A 869]